MGHIQSLIQSLFSMTGDQNIAALQSSPLMALQLKVRDPKGEERTPHRVLTARQRCAQPNYAPRQLLPRHKPNFSPRQARGRLERKSSSPQACPRPMQQTHAPRHHRASIKYTQCPLQILSGSEDVAHIRLFALWHFVECEAAAARLRPPRSCHLPR